MQGFMILAFIGTEKDTLVLQSQGYWVMVRACRVCQGQL